MKLHCKYYVIYYMHISFFLLPKCFGDTSLGTLYINMFINHVCKRILCLFIPLHYIVSIIVAIIIIMSIDPSATILVSVFDIEICKFMICILLINKGWFDYSEQNSAIYCPCERTPFLEPIRDVFWIRGISVS